MTSITTLSKKIVVELLLTDTGSLQYEIKSDDVYKRIF